MTRSWWRAPVLLVPVIVVLAALFAIYAESAAHWTVMVRSVAIAAPIVLAITLLTARLTRDPVTAAVIVGMLVWVVVEWRMAVVLAFVLVGLATIQRLRGRRLVIRPGILIAATFALVIATIVRAVSTGTFVIEDFQVTVGHAAPAAASTDMPNVYLILVDGYPRQDTLADDFDFDNEPFLEGLELLGFSVNRQATTRFARTELTLASMQGAAISEVEVTGDGEGPRSTPIRRELRRKYLVNSPVMDELRRLGYTMGYVPPPVTFVDWQGWDDRRDPGQPNDYEALVIQKSLLRFVLGPWLLDQGRERVDATLDELSRFDGQRFVLAHLEAPHPPFLWSAAGHADQPLACWYEVRCSLYNGFPDNLWLTESEYVERARPQIGALNDRVLRAVERLVETDPDAVIVIFSDHGTRFRDLDDPEANRVLFAARGTTASGADGLLPHLLAELSEAAP